METYEQEIFLEGPLSIQITLIARYSYTPAYREEYGEYISAGVELFNIKFKNTDITSELTLKEIKDIEYYLLDAHPLNYWNKG